MKCLRCAGDGKDPVFDGQACRTCLGSGKVCSVCGCNLDKDDEDVCDICADEGD